MFKRFLSLEWKAFLRSASFGKSLGLQIFLIFLAFYFGGIFLMIGFNLYPMLLEFFPGQDPLHLVNRFVLVWLIFELAFRFFLQSLPIVDIKPLLILPVPKRKVINYILSRSLYSFYNLLPLFLIVPFAIMLSYNGDYENIHMFSWMIAMVGLTLSVNFLNFIIKKKFSENIKTFLIVVGAIGILAILDYYQIFQISVWFGNGLDLLGLQPYLAALPLILLFGLFKWNQDILKKNFFLDAGLKQKEETADTRDFLWTRKFGDIAPFLQQDIKLIWRNKRPKTIVYISLLLLGYGLLFYPNEAYLDTPVFLIFVGVFITGIFMINFGQFIPAWDASYYPMIMTQNIEMSNYLAAKAGLITVSVVLLTILASPYIYFGWEIFLINIICAIYNIGINIPVLLYTGSFNRKRIELDKSPFMNYQGTGAAQWLAGIPLLVLPVLLFWFFYKIVSFEVGLFVLGSLGIIGIFLRNKALSIIAVNYKRNKYAMIEGFKQTGE